MKIAEKTWMFLTPLSTRTAETPQTARGRWAGGEALTKWAPQD